MNGYRVAKDQQKHTFDQRCHESLIARLEVTGGKANKAAEQTSACPSRHLNLSAYTDIERSSAHQRFLRSLRLPFK